ncbi:MAG: anti-sigma factor antagonist [Actinomycetota bacterium]
MQGFAVTAEQRGASIVVTASGEIDYVTSPAFHDCLAGAILQASHVVIDLAAVDFMDTSALMVVVGHWKKLMAVDGTLALAGARKDYIRVLWVTGLAGQIPMFDTAEQAVSSFQ